MSAEGRWKCRWSFSDRRGLTLPEMLFALLLLGMVLGVLARFFHFGYRSAEAAMAEARLQQQGRVFLARLAGECATARVACRRVNSQGQIEDVPALEVKENGARLDVYTDVDGDGRPEKISYRSREGRLERGMVPPQGSSFPYTYSEPVNWSTVLTGLQNGMVFTVPDLDGDARTLNARPAVQVEVFWNDLQWVLPRPLCLQGILAARSRGQWP